MPVAMQRADRYHRHLFIGALLLAVLASGCAGSEGPPGDSDGEATIVHSGEDEAIGIPFQDDGTLITLRGHFYSPLNEVGVILSHMLPSDQSAWSDFAAELAEEDYAVVTFDFRGFGETGGERALSKLDEDLSRVVRALRDRGKQQIFLIGASMGGTASLVVAAREDLAGVIAISAPAQFENQDALAAVASITEPKLFIASEDDTEAATSLAALIGASGAPKDEQIYTGDRHGTDLLQGEHSAAILELILAFLKEHSS